MDEKRLSLPLILISPAFFSFWLFLFAGFVADLVPGPKMVFFPESGFMYSFNGTFLFALLMLLPFAGSILLIRELEGQPHLRQAALPLCFAAGAIAVSLVLYTFYEPSCPALRPLGYLVNALIIAFALLPACAAYFFVSMKRKGCLLRAETKLSLTIGIAGLILLLLILYGAVMGQPRPASPDNEGMWNFTPAGIVVVIYGLVYWAILLPVAGMQFLKPGLRDRNLSHNK